MVRQLRAWGSVCFVLSLLVWRPDCHAISLDKEGDIKLGVRTYVNARVGTEETHDGAPVVPIGGGAMTSTSATFPHSDAGHLRQNRAFIEVELNHDVDRLLKEGIGPLSLLNDLPFKIKGLAYHLTFRGEADGLYDWGPREYSTAAPFKNLQKASLPLPQAPALGIGVNQPETFINVEQARAKLRHLGTDRERLFQAYVEGNAGSLFVRVGRQILSWGETDAFQLLDRINPTDSSFGGFLIPLDERRVPLDMLVTNYYIGDEGPFSEAHIEGFVAIDDKVGFYPGTPAGSPWALPSLGATSTTSTNFLITPTRTVNDARGGVQLKFNAFDATFGIAHYYTYFDTEALQVETSGFNSQPSAKTLLNAWDDGLPCPNDPSDPSKGVNYANPHCGYAAHVVHTAPKVQVSGVSTTFALPQWYSVVRGEMAYFKDEPAFSQGQLDPFIFNLEPCKKPGDQGCTTGTLPQSGGRRLRDSFNAVVGLDMNQWVRVLNPNQTFFFSTQFFYKHILNAGSGNIYLPNCNPKNANCLNPDREVLPVELDVAASRKALGQRLEPVFISQPSNQYLQTLFIGTSYRSGTISPSMTIFYDWGGAFAYQPAITFSRDPFRFAMDYSIIDSHIYKGGSGISLLKDRDNVQFRFEYVI